jgi:hypothetical protein
MLAHVVIHPCRSHTSSHACSPLLLLNLALQAMLTVYAYGCRYLVALEDWPVTLGVLVAVLRLAFTVATGQLLVSGGGTTAAVAMHALQAIVLLRLLPHSHVLHALRSSKKEQLAVGGERAGNSEHMKLPHTAKQKQAVIEEQRSLLGRQAEPKVTRPLLTTCYSLRA